MSQGWQLRAAGLEDLEPIVGLIRAEDLRYRGRSDIDLGYVQEQIASDQGFDAARDIVVAEDRGDVLAAAIVNPRSLNITVHLDHDVPELRAALIAWGERRQAELGRDLYRVAVPAGDRPAVESYRRAGYRRERFYAAMTRPLAPGTLPLGTLPSGYRLRRIERERDVGALHRLDQAAFRAGPDFVAESRLEYERRHIAISSYAPQWSVLVETAGGSITASLIGRRRPDPELGYIAILAVDPDHQRRGLATALLRFAFRAIHDAGCTRAELHVASDNPRALDLYTAVGMRESERFDHYVREARPGPGPGA